MDIVGPWFRLGYVIPHLHTDMDAYQFYRVAPDGMMLVTTQLDLGAYTLEAVERELPTLWDRVDVLAAQNVDRIALSGVPVASVLGRDRMLQLIDDVSSRTGRPADTDAEAIVAALRHLGAARIALATRWSDEVTAAVAAYFRHAGIEVLAGRARGRSLAANKMADPLEDHQLALDLGREVLRAAPRAQALVLPGGLWFAIHAAPILEAEFGVPVVLNITATTWSALLGREPLQRPRAGAGLLLQTL